MKNFRSYKGPSQTAKVRSAPAAIPEPPHALRTHQFATLLLLFVAGAVNFFDRVSLSVSNTTIAREMHWSATQMGWLLSVLAGIWLVATPANRSFAPARCAANARSWPELVVNCPATYRFYTRNMELQHLPSLARCR